MINEFIDCNKCSKIVHRDELECLGAYKKGHICCKFGAVCKECFKELNDNTRSIKEK